MALPHCPLRTAFAAGLRGLRGCSCIFLDVTAATLNLNVPIVLWAFPSLGPDMTTYAALHISNVNFEAGLARFMPSLFGSIWDCLTSRSHATNDDKTYASINMHTDI